MIDIDAWFLISKWQKEEEMKRVANERIIFRLIHTPCCHTLLCWVNPRLPNVCPECGERIYARLKTGEGIMTSSEGWLRVMDYDAKGTWAEYNELQEKVNELEQKLQHKVTGVSHE